MEFPAPIVEVGISGEGVQKRVRITGIGGIDEGLDGRRKISGSRHPLILHCDNEAVQGFARREFQLMLLRRTADFQPDLVEAAYAELGADRRAYMAAHTRWQTMLRSRRAPAGLDLYRAVLGPPDTERAERFGDVVLTLDSGLGGLWPDLRWEVVVGTGGVVLNG